MSVKWLGRHWRWEVRSGLNQRTSSSGGEKRAVSRDRRRTWWLEGGEEVKAALDFCLGQVKESLERKVASFISETLNLRHR